MDSKSWKSMFIKIGAAISWAACFIVAGGVVALVGASIVVATNVIKDTALSTPTVVRVTEPAAKLVEKQCPPPRKTPAIEPLLQIKTMVYTVRKANNVEVLRASLHPECHCTDWKTSGKPPHFLSPDCDHYACEAAVKLKLSVKYQPTGPYGLWVECVYYDPQAELPLNRDANEFKIGTGYTTVDFVGEIPWYRFRDGDLSPGTAITIDCHTLPYPRPPGLAVVRMPRYKSRPRVYMPKP